jgi:hypothetical protein
MGDVAELLVRFAGQDGTETLSCGSTASSSLLSSGR